MKLRVLRARLAALAFLIPAAGCLFEGKGGGTETESLAVTGRVVNADRTPAAFARVSVRPADFLFDLVSSDSAERGVRDTVTDAQGRFGIKDLPAGEYRIEIAGGEARGAIHDFVLPESGKTLDLGKAQVDTLRLRGSIAGSILPDSESHVASLIQVFGMDRLVQADPQGGFVLYQLPEGTYEIRISSLQPFRREAVIRGIEVRAGERTRLEPVALEQEAKLVFRSDSGGLRITGVDSTNPVIYDNERWDNGPDDEYIWAKASAGRLDLRGNIVTRDFRGGTPVELQLRKAKQELLEARLAGFANIPEITAGATARLSWPASGKLEDIPPMASPGSDLIVTEARKATPEKPLLVLVGGPLTTVAQAWLTDPSIASRMVVAGCFTYSMQPDDSVANYLVARKCRFVQWGRNYAWSGKPDTSLIRGIPVTKMGERVRGFLSANTQVLPYVDIAPAAFLFRRSLWKGADIVKVTPSLTVRPASDFTFDFVDIPQTANDWAGYQPEFYSTLGDPRAYHPIGLPGRVEAESFQNPFRASVMNVDTTAGTMTVSYADGGYTDHKVASAGGAYKGLIRYRSAAGARLGLSIDGVAAAEVPLPAAPDWAEAALPSFPIEAGEHVLRLSVTGGFSALDVLDLSRP